MRSKLNKSTQLKFDLADLNDYEQLKSENDRLRTQNEELLAKIERLQHQIRESTYPSSEMHTPSKHICPEKLNPASDATRLTVTRKSSIHEKVALFRNFFRGREDVYAIRGFDKEGRAAYFRAREYLGKENGKVVWGDDFTLTDKVIADHLQREDRPVTVGILPASTQ